MTAQGKKWWGDPSSPDYDKTEAMSPFGEVSRKRTIGSVFSEQDRFILQTLYYPFRVRFGYENPDPAKFDKDLREIRGLFGDLLDFEKQICENLGVDPGVFKLSGNYLLLRASFQDRWDVLDEIGDYPHMLTPLQIA